DGRGHPGARQRRCVRKGGENRVLDRVRRGQGVPLGLRARRRGRGSALQEGRGHGRADGEDALRDRRTRGNDRARGGHRHPRRPGHHARGTAAGARRAGALRLRHRRKQAQGSLRWRGEQERPEGRLRHRRPTQAPLALASGGRGQERRPRRIEGFGRLPQGPRAGAGPAHDAAQGDAKRGVPGPGKRAGFEEGRSSARAHEGSHPGRRTQAGRGAPGTVAEGARRPQGERFGREDRDGGQVPEAGDARRRGEGRARRGDRIRDPQDQGSPPRARRPAGGARGNGPERRSRQEPARDGARPHRGVPGRGRRRLALRLGRSAGRGRRDRPGVEGLGRRLIPAQGTQGQPGPKTHLLQIGVQRDLLPRAQSGVLPTKAHRGQDRPASRDRPGPSPGQRVVGDAQGRGCLRRQGHRSGL
ncbi:MAG: hypothetical protein AVDCRST_MAG12-52, partial [uncultured Rubrobacteraceae bacterium]